MSRPQSNVTSLHGMRGESSKQALTRLYREHHVALRRFIKVRLGGGEDREDIVQEVFVRLAKIDHLARLLPEDGEGNRSYLFRVANNLVINMARHRAVKEAFLDDEKHRVTDSTVPGAGVSTEKIVLAQEGLELVRQAIAGMKPAWRHAFLLSRYKQKSYAEIAKYMDVTVKQVEHYMHNALTVIRKSVRESQGPLS